MADGSRYERLAALPSMGKEGLARVRGCHIAIVGLGGLGCASASVLAASGVGRLKLIDPDVVDQSNLDRQLLYTPADVGRKKVEVAGAALRAQNPDLQVTVLPDSFHDDLLDGVHVCVVGVDGLHAREEVMRAAVARSLPTVFGAVDGYAGTVQTWTPGFACYGCVWGEEVGPGPVVAFGPAAHLIGTMQASEALLLGAGLPPAFVGSVFAIDLLAGTARTLRVRRRADCALCRA